MVDERQNYPLFWNRYVDDTFTMFHNKDSANEFLYYLNSCHSNIKFTIEFEQNNERTNELYLSVKVFSLI